MEALLAAAFVRVLTLGDFNLTEDAPPEVVRQSCDRFADLLTERYLSGAISWQQADAAANHIYNLMIKHCGSKVPGFAWDVFLAFDTAECTSPGGDIVTKPLLSKALARKISTGGGSQPEDHAS